MMIKTIDLFAGAGGLSYGFEMTKRFQIVAAAENNPNARKTYLLNHRSKDIVMIEDVRGYDFHKLADDMNGIDVVIGGPPCQGFSNANRQKNHIISMNNSLVKEYFRAVREIMPKAFVMENVSMLSSETHRFYDSEKDHDEVIKLGIKMRDEEIVISEENYDGVDCFAVLTGENKDVQYCISDELLQLLNVLYKNRDNKERLPKYLKKNTTQINKEINKYFEGQTYNYEILHKVKDLLKEGQMSEIFDDLGHFIKFQKSFRLISELKENQILYHLVQDENKKISAQLKSYSVIDYVNSILGDTYKTDRGEVCSLWFGVPQERRRFIMIGVRSDIAIESVVSIPKEDDEKYEVVNVGQAISDLSGYTTVDEVSEIIIPYNEDTNLSEYALLMRKGSKGVSNHIIPKTRETALERFKALGEGENFHKLKQELKNNYTNPDRTQNSIYLRLDSKQPSGTVVNVRKSMWIHPTIDRAISIREAARLQSFPDKFIFAGTKDSQYQQVGNAVPPLMAKGIARKILKYLKNI